MEKNTFRPRSMDAALVDTIKSELSELDLDQVEVNGSLLKPSQCYRFELNPFHLMYNTNCPDSLKEKINTILTKYISADEDRAPQ